MATPKARKQERIGTEGDAVNGTADRPFNGAATGALPPLPAAPVPGSAAWWTTIRALTHYDSAYPYDPPMSTTTTTRRIRTTAWMGLPT